MLHVPRPCFSTIFQGRCPHYLEPAVIIVLTDGGKLTGPAGVQQEVKYT